MKLIALPDLHDGGTKYLPLIADQLAQVDYVVLVGDLTNGGREADAERVVRAVQEFNPSILGVPGNWDRDGVDSYLSQLGINLHRKHLIIDGIAFLGVGGALPSIGQSPTEYTESTFQTYLTEANAGLNSEYPKILVSHQPPFNTLNDDIGSESHVGSHAVRAFIEQVQPMLCLTGHIHAGIGISVIGATQVINPGPLWQGGYAYIEVNSGGILSSEIRRCKIEF